MANCLVTGGAGFIGSHIVTALAERGDKVRVLDNLSTGKRANLDHIREEVDLVVDDLIDRDAVAAAVKDIDFVFHHAALASVPRSLVDPHASHEACATGTLNLLDACRNAGVRRVVYAGSSSAYGDAPTLAKREVDPLSPLSPYAAAKLAGESYCMAFHASFGLEIIILRYFNVYGPRQDPNSEYSAVIPKFVAKMIQDEQPIVFGDGRQSRDFVFIDDVVRCNLLAAERAQAAGKVFNVACGRQSSLLELIASINRALGTTIEPIFADPRAGDVCESLADISAARAILGYEPSVDFDEGLQRSIAYYREVASGRDVVRPEQTA